MLITHPEGAISVVAMRILVGAELGVRVEVYPHQAQKQQNPQYHLYENSWMNS